MTINIKFVAGLPRSGSTLLCSILDQSKETYIEGTSGLFGLILSTLENCLGNGSRAFYIHQQNRETKTLEQVLPNIINGFYNDVDCNKVVIDKSRGWNNHHVISDMEKYIKVEQKVVCLYRPIEEIVISFGSLLEEDKRENFYYNCLRPELPICLAVDDLTNAISSNSKSYKFIKYDDLACHSDKTINDICNFFGIKKIDINENMLSTFNKEPENTLGFTGLHKVRNKINKIKHNIELPSDIKERCSVLDLKIQTAFNKVNRNGIPS